MNLETVINQSKNRNILRQKLGVGYFTLKRRMYWIFGGIKFARRGGTLPPTMLEHAHFTHQTPIYRAWQNVDPQLERNKRVNFGIALAKIDMVTLQPGETFSFWRLLGKPTRRKGYIEGVVLRNGVLGGGIGGGLCHLTGFTYWMTLHTPLTVTERHRHSHDTSPAGWPQPFGSDATCFYNYKDLMITNNTDHAFQLRLEATEEHLRGAWISDAPPVSKYEVYQKHHSIEIEKHGKYIRHGVLHRRVYDLDGVLKNDEFISENYAVQLYPSTEAI